MHMCCMSHLLSPLLWPPPSLPPPQRLSKRIKFVRDIVREVAGQVGRQYRGSTCPCFCSTSSCFLPPPALGSTSSGLPALLCLPPALLVGPLYVWPILAK